MSGQLWVVAAPSGAGKTSLVNALVDSVSGIKLSISHTTRPPRASDEEGKDYFFIDKPTFEAMITEQAFLEYANVFGNYYGTSKQWVEHELAKGEDVILEIDWQGAEQVSALLPDSRSIFILPPSPGTLRHRLEKRAEDQADVIAKRLQEATEEMSHCEDFDYIIINDKFEEALLELSAIILAQRLKSARQAQKYGTLLQSLRK